MKKLIKNIHPGEILLKDFLEPIGMSTRQLAEKTGIPHVVVVGIVKEEHPITLETAMKLSKFIGTSIEMWLEMQMDHDLEEVRRHRMRMQLKNKKVLLKKKKMVVGRKKTLSS